MLVRQLEISDVPPDLGQVAFGIACVGVLVSEDASHPRHGVFEEFLGKDQLVLRRICAGARVSMHVSYYECDRVVGAERATSHGEMLSCNRLCFTDLMNAVECTSKIVRREKGFLI